jgi:hypothetical protein
MSQIFKNLLVCSRDCSNTNITNLVKKTTWFEDRKPFDYFSPSDKIIIFFTDQVFEHNKLINVTDDNLIIQKIGNKIAEGFIKIYCDNCNIKVYNLNFTSLDVFKKNIQIFREYLIETVKFCKTIMNITNIDSYNFRIYWDKNVILNESVEHILKNYKLLDTYNTEKFYTFTEHDIASTPTLGSSNTFGTTPTLGSSNTFGTTPTLGSSNTFGTTPTLGSSNTFGTTPTLGSSNTFGTTPTPQFSSTFKSSTPNFSTVKW